MILRKTVDQNDPPQEDPKQSFYGRAKRITGRPLTGIEDVRGLDYAKLMNMSDEEMVGLLNLVNRVAPEEQGDVQGGIGRAMDNFSDIKEQATILKTNMGWILVSCYRLSLRSEKHHGTNASQSSLRPKHQDFIDEIEQSQAEWDVLEEGST